MTDATPTIEELAARLNAWALCFEEPVTAPIPKGDGHWSGRMMADLREAASALSPLSPLIEAARPVLREALRSYQQADQDGVMVLASRQACEEAAAILDALSTFPAPASPWRPIETAPRETNWREGPYLLLANEHHGGVGKWYQDDYGEQGWVDEHLELIEPPPTHWQPMPALPAPPTTSDGGEG